MSLYSNILDQPQGVENFLQGLPLFARLDREGLEQIAAHIHRRSFAPGVTLFHQDMPGSMLYIIEQGYVRVFSIGRTGQELTLNICGPGEIFGELSILDNQYHSATAITLSQTVVQLLAKTELDRFMERYPQIERAIIQLLVARLRTTTRHTEAMTFQDVQGRLACEILNLGEKHGQLNGNAIKVDIPLTQGDLATMVGASRESVNKALSALRAQNLVDIDNSSLTVLNPSGLRRMIQERGR